MRRVFERGERRKIAVDSENCRDRWKRGARIARLYKNTKTFYKPESYPCINVSRYKGRKRWESAESENEQLQRMNAWVVEVREGGMWLY